jgi:probable F420-dependent oxidoreductase
MSDGGPGSKAERAFRFGAVAAFARSAQEWAATARRVEELGFSTLLCPDTFGTLAPFSALAAAAGATRTLRLGTYVLAAPYRSPGTVAWETASLDLLSDGRFELGLGAGRPDARADAQQLDAAFGSAGERITRIEETIRAVAERYSASDDAGPGAAVRGVQRPRPPIMVACSGPRLMRLASERADIIALSVPPQSTEDDLAAKAALLREIAGAGFDRLELAVNIALVGDEIPPYAASWLGADPQQLVREGAITVLNGTPRAMADTLLRRRDRSAVSYITVNAMFAEQFAPVIELLTGV